ncbi:hypothetical protein HZ326_19274 [Fusarium oxysporum f. sp. albedinis]|nr:hypothetical protein HZ326_19274 [Fusarium oxysporum f. sp. albedinis]
MVSSQFCIAVETEAQGRPLQQVNDILSQSEKHNAVQEESPLPNKTRPRKGEKARETRAQRRRACMSTNSICRKRSGISRSQATASDSGEERKDRQQHAHGSFWHGLDGLFVSSSLLMVPVQGLVS